MARQYVRLLKFLPLLVFAPIFWTAYATYAFESYLSGLSITLSDFPAAYADALSTATVKNEHTFDFDYSIFPSNVNDTDHTKTIPPIIHFIYFANLYAVTDHGTQSEIPSHGSHAPARCELFNPAYTIYTWNASAAYDFLSSQYPWSVPLFESYPYPIQRVDMLKYFLLHHYGGVYEDLDIACRRPLEPLLDFAAWFPKASPLGANNDLMAARPGHPLLEYMIARLEARNKWFGTEWATVFWSTGPRFLSDMLREWYDAHPNDRYVRGSDKSAEADLDAFFILPEQFYSQDPGYTFFGHSPGGTWYGDDARFVIWLLDRPWIIALVIGTPVALHVATALRKRRASAHKSVKSVS